jgi:hypothetical protein
MLVALLSCGSFPDIRLSSPHLKPRYSTLADPEHKGTKLASAYLRQPFPTAANLPILRGPFMKKDQAQTQVQQQDKGISLETMIAVGVLGWLAIGMVMMGLGIW